MNEHKEFIEDEFNIEAMLAVFGICTAVVALFLAPTVYIFLTRDTYNEELNYVWVTAYFASQAFGFLILDPLVILLVALYVAEPKRRLTKPSMLNLAKYFRDSLIVWEDYQFAIAFQKSVLQ